MPVGFASCPASRTWHSGTEGNIVCTERRPTRLTESLIAAALMVAGIASHFAFLPFMQARDGSLPRSVAAVLNGVTVGGSLAVLGTLIPRFPSVHVSCLLVTCSAALTAAVTIEAIC